MTNKEINNYIKEAKNPEWFKTIEAQFTFSHLDIDFIKKGFADIYQYVSRQDRGWSKIGSNLPNELNQSKHIFTTLLNKLDAFIENHFNKDDNQLNSYWREIGNDISQLNNRAYLPIDNPKTLFLIEIAKKGTYFYQGAYNYFFNDNNNLSLNRPEEFAGAILAYEYQFEDGSKIPQRRSAEKSSNAQIRNAFERTFTETQQSVGEFIKETKEKSKKHAKEVIDLVSEKKLAYENWVNECKKNDQDYTKFSLARVKELEELYEEKLRFKSPAKYWNDRAIELKTEGDKWRTWFIASIISGVIILILIIGILSNKSIEDLFSSYGNAIRFSIILITLVSLLVYGIRTFAKLMFSAYHLRRDSEEREQLAYFYLAMKENKGIEESERYLVIQSLFSRADSGLLKDDSGPSMPSGGIVEKIIGGK